MNSSERRMGRLLTILLGCASALSCTLSSDTAELGVYQREAQSEGDADGSTPAPDAGASGGDASALPAFDDAAMSPGPSMVPPCLDTGCVATVPVVEDSPNLRCFDLVAHSKTDPFAPYPVPFASDHYVRFTMRSPFVGAHYLRYIVSLVDAGVALHHMELYEHDATATEAVTENGTLPEGARLVHSWSPGRPEFHLDPSVAIATRENPWYTLEIHYKYARGPGGPTESLTDSSGLHVCFSAATPQYTLSRARLGSETVMGASATGTCTPENSQPVQLLAVHPRMERYGTRAKLTLNRLNGSQEVVYDEVYDLDDGALRPLPPTQLQPGESLTSSCEYQASSSDAEEVCELYVLHWPPHTLVSGSREGDSCLE